MGQKKNYFLVARNRETNQVKAISINNHYGLSLEEIDTFTTHYMNVSHLKEDFLQKGIIDSLNVDLFSIHSFKGKVYYTELLYQNWKEIEVIAQSYLNDQKEDTLDNRDYILNGFCKRMGNDSKYYDFVMYGNHNISLKFVSYFQNSRYKTMYKNKYIQGGWARNSYSLIHNILESYDRYELGKNYSENIYEKDYLERNQVKDVLLEITDSDYSYYGGNLFDLVYVKR